MSVVIRNLDLGDTIEVESFAKGSNFTERYSSQKFPVDTCSPTNEGCLGYELEYYYLGFDYRFAVQGGSEEWRLSDVVAVQRKVKDRGWLSEDDVCSNDITYYLNGSFARIEGRDVESSGYPSHALITIQR